MELQFSKATHTAFIKFAARARTAEAVNKGSALHREEETFFSPLTWRGGIFAPSPLKKKTLCLFSV